MEPTEVTLRDYYIIVIGERVLDIDDTAYRQHPDGRETLEEIQTPVAELLDGLFREIRGVIDDNVGDPLEIRREFEGLKGVIIQFGMMAERRGAYVQTNWHQPDQANPALSLVEGIPRKIYATPLKELFKPRVSGESRVFNCFVRSVSTPTVGAVLNLDVERLEVIRNLGLVGIAIFHRVLKEKGWFQYAKSATYRDHLSPSEKAKYDSIVGE